jgi:hypothetical protein
VLKEYLSRFHFNPSKLSLYLLERSFLDYSNEETIEPNTKVVTSCGFKFDLASSPLTGDIFTGFFEKIAAGCEKISLVVAGDDCSV